jgi:hypothetical protein
MCRLQRTHGGKRRTVAGALSLDDIDEGGEPAVFSHLGGDASAGLAE